MRLGLAALTPLAPDEAYYRVWSRVLAPGYLDDAPMVALWIRLGTAIAGATPLGVRLLGPPAAALGSLLLYRAATDLFPHLPRLGLIAVLFINATLLFGAGSVIMTPDTPLLFFWTLGLFAMARLIATGNGRWWLLAGLAAGLALDSKYTALLFIAAVFVWLLATDLGRSWLRRPEPWLGLALALIAFAPVIAWNAAHHWASFLKQGGRVGAWHPWDALRFETELVLGQAGLFTPLVFAFAVAGTWHLARRAWREQHPPSALVSLLTLLPAALFLQHALGDRVQGNWPAILYPSAALAAAALPGPAWSRWRWPAAGLGFLITALVYLQALAAPLPLPPRLDPTLRQLGGWRQFAATVAEAGRAETARFVATANYGDASELAFLQNLPVVGLGPRWTYFRLPPASPIIAGQTGLLLERTGAAAPDPRLWSLLAPPAEIVRARNGLAAERFRLYGVRAKAGVTGALLPGPDPSKPGYPPLSNLCDAPAREQHGGRMSAKGQKRGRGNDKGAGIVIRREEAVEGPAHGGSWKIAYADFVTAMMAFFLLMWLINATTEAQRQGLANYFAPSSLFSFRYSGSGKPFGGRTPFSVGEMVSDNGAIEVITGKAEPERNARSDPLIPTPGALPPNGAPAPPIRPGSPTVNAASGGLANATSKAGGAAGPDIGAPSLPLALPLSAGHQQAAFSRAADQVRAALRQDPALAGLAGHVAIDITAEGLRIQIMDGKHRPMFALGSPALAPLARLFVARLAPILARLSGPIAISGYTDAAPYHGVGQGDAQGHAMSNWDLSAERANATRSLLVADGLPEPRIARVAGYADRDLLLPADPLAAANRRIAILVMRANGNMTAAPTPGAHR